MANQNTGYFAARAEEEFELSEATADARAAAAHAEMAARYLALSKEFGAKRPKLRMVSKVG